MSTQVHFTAGKVEIQKLNTLPKLRGKWLAKLGLFMDCSGLFPPSLHLLFFPVTDYFKFHRPTSGVCLETGKATRLNVIITEILLVMMLFHWNSSGKVGNCQGKPRAPRFLVMYKAGRCQTSSGCLVLVSEGTLCSVRACVAEMRPLEPDCPPTSQNQTDADFCLLPPWTGLAV